MGKCGCSLRTKLVGDGCRKCNPDLYISLLEDEIKEARDLIMESLYFFGGYCHASESRQDRMWDEAKALLKKLDDF